jgi:hypothetical protein
MPPYRETRDYVKRVRAVLASMETKGQAAEQR